MLHEQVRGCLIDPDERVGGERSVSLVQPDAVAYLRRTARVRRALLGRPGGSDAGAGAGRGAGVPGPADGESDLSATLQGITNRYRGVRMEVQLHSGNLRSYIARLSHMLEGTHLAGNTRRMITSHIERGAVILANWDRLATTAERVASDAEQLTERAQRLRVRTLDRPIVAAPWRAIQDTMRQIDLGMQHMHAVGVIGWYRRYYERYLPIAGTYEACRQLYERPREPDDDDPDLPPESARRYTGAPGFADPVAPPGAVAEGGRHVVYQSESGASQVQTPGRAVTATEPWRISSLAQGYAAPWNALARFFKRGEKCAGDPHRRRFWFPDDSFVEIQAHVPVATRSRENRLAIVGTALSAGGGVLWWSRNVVVAAVAGIVAALGMVAGLPYDAVWQGYTARFYRRAGDPMAWEPRYFYGWKRSLDVTCRIRVAGETDPARFPNLADDPSSFIWSGWYSGNAAERHASSADSLVHSMAAFSPANANASAMLARGRVGGAVCSDFPAPWFGSLTT